jgi:hypothetical protein
LIWTLVGLVGIWLAVGAISVFAPDMVSGSEQEHLPIAALTSWLWGAIGTILFLVAIGKLRRTGRPEAWMAVGVATLVVWGAAAIVGIAAPEFVTGTDPTRIPLGAILAPIGAVMLTALASVVAYVFVRPDEGRREV